VWLLSWLPGQGTGLHDHGASSGLLTVVQGELAERSLSRAGEIVRTLRPGTQRVVAGEYLHEVVNTSLEPAVSIHLYSPGLVEMNQYGTAPAVPRHGALEGT
jgi:predicted metal-dependent enzyme (double-stranded beta helix superfamily)